MPALALLHVSEPTRRERGSYGGGWLGAGGGGFILFFVRPEHQSRVKDALKDLLYVPFQFETSGSQIIFYESDYLSECNWS